MVTLGGFNNLDLLIVGIALASIGILGFVIFLNNRASMTNRTFFYFALATIFWGAMNFFQYQITASPALAFWILRFVLFFAVWQAFALFQLFYVFPREQVVFPSFYRKNLVPLVLITAFLTLTPLVFSEIAETDVQGQILRVKNGPGIFLFGVVSVGLVASAIFLLLQKTIRAPSAEKPKFRPVLFGSFIMFFLIIAFNFILPAFFDNPRFIPFGALFILPFIACAAYAIFKHRLLNVRVVATEILTLVLAIITLLEVLFADSFPLILFRVSIFALVIGFGVLLIRSVRREVEQRERLQILTNQLAKANEQLRKLDQVKSEFISIASHQLRAPLTVIKGYVSLVTENSFGDIPEKAKEALGKVFFSANQLVKLVNDMLDLSRMESGKIKYRHNETDFLELVSKTIDEFKMSAEKKGLGLKLENKTENVPKLVLDIDKIRETLVNLLDNAIKYSTSPGEVLVTLDQKGQQAVRMSVRDQGLGVKSEDIPRLFTKFIRTEDARKMDSGGTGIGLYLVKRIIEDHGGKVGAESEGIGKGSTFWIELPFTYVHPPS